MSDKNVACRWVENAYWQYFCGYDFGTMRTHPISLINTSYRIRK
ncbi:hypothetical protein NEOC65_000834 [Neochlamydia sp. AcF65]|nr:hypothetical protein [Neochlamydia sp. AcF65]